MKCVALVLTAVFVAGCEFNSAAGIAHRQALAAGFSVSPAAAASEAVAVATSLPQLDESSQLSDYLAYAALNNPGLEAAFDQWKAALERVPQVTALPDPRFTYGYFIREVETRVGPQRQTFGVAQEFPWFGKLDLRGDVAGQAANAAQKRYEAAKLKLFYEVKDAWYEYYYLAQSIAVTKENMELLRHLDGVARSRYRAVAASHPDVVRAQVEFGKLEDRYRALLELRDPLRARLNAALNRPMEAPIPWPDQIAVPQAELVQQELIDTLLESNPELEAMDFEIAARQREIELAKKEYYPDFQLGVSTIDTGDAIMRDVPDSGQDPVLASIMLEIPIWREKYAAGVREARLRHLAARRQRTDTANSLSAQLKLSLYRFRDAGRKISLYRDTLLPKAEEALNVTESAYRAGTGTFTDLVDAERILLEFQLDYERALANRAQSLARLEMLVGRGITSAGNPLLGQNVDNTAAGGTDAPSDLR